MRAFVILLVICCTWQQLFAAKILCLVGTAEHSNPSWTQPLFEALAGRGHELTVISTATNPVIRNVKYIQLHNGYDVIAKRYVVDKHYYSNWNIGEILIWYDALLGSCRSFLEQRQKRLKLFKEENLEYNLIIYDATYSMDCLVNIFLKKKIVPVLALSSGKLTANVMDLMQAEDTISAAKIPHFISQLPLNMNYWQRVQNHLMYWADSFIRLTVALPTLNGILENGFLQSQVQIMLLNTHPVLDYVQNMPPNIIEVGGLHIRAESEPLPINIAHFVDRFTEGLVYINLPHIELMEGGIRAIEIMITEFSQFGFLWDVKNLKEFQLSKSLHNLKTVHYEGNVQQDVLALSNLKAFVTHGDSFGLQEAVYNAVPVIVLPLIMDQLNNAKRTEERYLGVRIPTNEFQQDSFAVALKNIIRDDIYLHTLSQAQLNFRTRQSKPVDLAVWYAEQLVGDPQLFRHLRRTETREQSYFVGHSLDVIALPIVIIVFLTGNIIYIFVHFVEIMQTRNKKQRTKQVPANAKDQEKETIKHQTDDKEKN